MYLVVESLSSPIKVPIKVLNRPEEIPFVYVYLAGENNSNKTLNWQLLEGSVPVTSGTLNLAPHITKPNWHGWVQVPLNWFFKKDVQYYLKLGPNAQMNIVMNPSNFHPKYLTLFHRR